MFVSLGGLEHWSLQSKYAAAAGLCVFDDGCSAGWQECIIDGQLH